MAFEYISSVEIVCSEKINIPNEPKNANYYKLKSGKVMFFYVNSSPGRKMEILPDGITQLSFDSYEPPSYWIYYGNPTFYDENENL